MMVLVVEQKKVPLTQDAYDRLREKLDAMEGHQRQRIIDDIAAARSHGDLSENAEYHAARERQGQHEAEVRRIRAMLENAEIIEADDDATVKAGKVVAIRIEDDAPETYLIGTREERAEDMAVLTPESPMGQAIIGRSVGETVVAKAPRGEMKIEIVEVRGS